MIRRNLMVLVAFAAVAAGAATPESAPCIFESPAPVTATSEIDKLVVSRVSSLGISPALCSDAVFVRRVYLDAIGTLPTAAEAREFIQATNQDKRAKLIDRLLERDEFADYWSMKWGDILRIKAEFPVNLWPNAAQAYHRWVRASISSNKPYDQFARELLTSSGSNFRVGPVNFYRAIQDRTPEGIASAVALTFMGTRTDSWAKEKLAGMAVFFSQVGYKPTREWKEENVFWDPLTEMKGTNDPAAALAVITPKTATFPDGRKVEISLEHDPREVFADWLITPKNPWFTRSIVNRQWSWLLGRGIIHEPDDIREDNRPVNPALLDYLEKQMIAGGYDMKRMFRLILNSQTYQFSSVPKGDMAEAEANFGVYGLRRLDAEVLIDAINKVTGATDLYTSAIPEPFTYIPADMPAIAIADGSITSPFLALFGRSARATGMENERANKIMPSQWLHLLNSSHIQQKIESGPELRALINARRKPAETIEELYLAILSRFPTEEELKPLEAYGKPSKNGVVKSREDWIDIAWSLINSVEFVYRH